MSEYYDIMRDWNNPSFTGEFRKIQLETFGKTRVVINGSEATFPFGKNRQVPDRFKIINMQSKAQFFSEKSPMIDDNEDYDFPFFNQQDFEDKSYIIVTEGEWDCLSWIEAGYNNAVSLPNGINSAPKLFEREFKYLDTFDEIYINFDADKHGKQMIEKIKQMVPKYKFRSIFFDIEDLKDANGALQAGYDLSEFFKNAERIRVKNVVHASEIPIDSIFDATPSGKTTGFVDIDSMLGGLRPHELTIITGDTGSGKTTLAANIAYNFTVRTNEGVWIASQEMRPAKLLEKIGSIALKQSIRSGNIDEYSRQALQKEFRSIRLFIDPHGDCMTIDSVLDGINYAHYAHKVKLVVIEDLGYLSPSVPGLEERESIELIMKKLHGKVLETGVHIILVVHPTQTKDDKGFMSMANLKGSSGIKQYADNVLIVQRLDRGFPKAHNVHKFSTLRIAKNRAMGVEGKVILEYHKDYDGFSSSVVTPEQVAEMCK